MSLDRFNEIAPVVQAVAWAFDMAVKHGAPEGVEVTLWNLMRTGEAEMSALADAHLGSLFPPPPPPRRPTIMGVITGVEREPHDNEDPWIEWDT